MNILKWVLFYIYSFVTLGALCVARGDSMVRFVGENGMDDETKKDARGKIVLEAQELALLMADSVQVTIIGSIQNGVIQQYEAAMQHNLVNLEQPAKGS